MKKKDKLIDIELSQLKGGENDIVNKNSFTNCTCEYNDRAKLVNENTVSGCTCECTNPFTS